MKLVKITHERCDEYDGIEYVLAPDGWWHDKVRDLVNNVIKEMLDDARQIKESPCKPSFNPVYQDYPDMTVREVQTLHAAQTEQYNAWLEKNKLLTRSFEERLCDKGFISLSDKNADLVSVKAYWGHNHGLDLNYVHSTF